jgi:hypothetical protein
VIPRWMYVATCPVVDCGAVARLWSEMPVELADRDRFIARALSGIGWLVALDRAFCPRHGAALRESLLDNPGGPEAGAIKWAIAERQHLRRIEVTP